MSASGFPRAFGPYVLVAELGRGGLGEVYLAWSGRVVDIAKLCVIKTMRPDVEGREVAHRRFLDEARITVSLSHANISAVYDVGQVGETSYIALEYVGRRTLRDVYERARERGVGLPEDVAIWLTSRVLEGLEHAHAARDPATGAPLQIVHRNVSPQNVMVRHDGAVKLVDFGLARSSVKVEQTQTGLVAGELTYMAPEQVRAQPVDARADQFAAAVMLYELIAGERYYEALREHEVAAAAASGHYRPRRWDSLSSTLQAVLAVALAGEPSARFGSCEAFLEALTTTLGAARVSDARRFQQVMKELFPEGEDAERAFLQSLPQPSSLRGAAAGSPAPDAPDAPDAPSAPAAAAAATSPPRPEEDTAALVSRIKPRRWPLFAAAGVVGLLLAAFAAVALVNPPSEAAEAARPTMTSGQEPAGERADTASDAPAPAIESTAPSAPSAPTEPTEPTERTEPTEPTVEPRLVKTEPRKKAAPRVGRAKAARTQNDDSRTKPESAVEPAQEPKGMTEIERFRATLSRCDDPCASVWRRQLAGRTEVPESARTSLRICLDRCQKEPK